MDSAEFIKIVCSNIKKIRKSKGIGMRKAAKLLGSYEQSINHFESGKSMPKPQNLCDLAKIYEVDVFDFFKTEEELKAKYVIKQLENELKFAREMAIRKHKQIKDLQEELAVLKAHMRG